MNKTLCPRCASRIFVITPGLQELKVFVKRKKRRNCSEYMGANKGFFRDSGDGIEKNKMRGKRFYLVAVKRTSHVELYA